MPRSSNREVKHELVKKRGKIRFRKFSRDGFDHFNLLIYVEGDLRDLESVEYELHPSFADPIRRVTQREGGFPLRIWTWGEFEIAVTFYLADGSTEQTVHNLLYSKLLHKTTTHTSTKRRAT